MLCCAGCPAVRQWPGDSEQRAIPREMYALAYTLLLALSSWAQFDQLLDAADGWGFSQMSGNHGMGPSPGAIKQQTIGLLHAVAYLRGRVD